MNETLPRIIAGRRVQEVVQIPEPISGTSAYYMLGDLVLVSITAVVDPTAKLGPKVRVNAGAIIEAGVVIMADSDIGENAIIEAGSMLGFGVCVYPGAVVHPTPHIPNFTDVHPTEVSPMPNPNPASLPRPALAVTSRLTRNPPLRSGIYGD
jgi:hypothetical protein